MVIDTSFAAPPAITYNSAGSAVTIVPTYESVFTHTQKADCLVTSCELRETACGAALALAVPTSVNLGAAPNYEITASEIIPAGYS